MSGRSSNRASHRHEPDALTLTALAWLAVGSVLLCLTPLPAHNPTYGWSPAFWLIVAPVAVLFTLHTRSILSPAGSLQRARLRPRPHG